MYIALALFGIYIIFMNIFILIPSKRERKQYAENSSKRNLL